MTAGWSRTPDARNSCFWRREAGHSVFTLYEHPLYEGKAIDMTDSQTSKRTRISLLLNDSMVGQTLRVCGWVRTFRNDRFLAVNDGSTIQNLQLVQ